MVAFDGCLGRVRGKSDGSGKDDKFKVLAARWDIGTDPIGEGGFGSVHLATNRKTGKVRTSFSCRSAASRELLPP